MKKLIIYFKKLISKFITKPVVLGYNFTGSEKLLFEHPPAGYYPGVNTFHKVVRDLGSFEVLKISKEDKTVTLTEICTDNEITISIAAFELLFQPIPKLILRAIVTKGHQ
jgi:hypothetical protein